MATLPYVGNDDFRGYLAALAKAGDGRAQLSLNYTGNDGGVNRGALNEYNQASPMDSTPDEQLQNDAANYVTNAYKTWSGARSAGVTGGAGGGTADDGDPAADRAYLDTQEGQLRGLLESALRTKDQGFTQIDDSFNKESQRTAEKRAGAQAGYVTQREDTTRDKMGAIDQVSQGGRTLSDSVRKLLGMASGRNSSAYQEAAPNAIARDTSVKRTGVNDTYGRNFRDIDTSEESTMGGFDDYVRDLGDQRQEKRKGLEEGVLQQEQGIYGNLAEIGRQRALLDGGGYNRVRDAMAPAAAQIASRQSQLDGLFDKFRTPFQTKDVEVKAPQLADYTVDKTMLGGAGAAGGQAGDTSPYYNFVRKKFATA